MTVIVRTVLLPACFVILTFNLLGDTWNATVGGDPRGYVGIPVTVALLVYLARQGARLAASRNPQEDR